MNVRVWNLEASYDHADTSAIKSDLLSLSDFMCDPKKVLSEIRWNVDPLIYFVPRNH